MAKKPESIEVGDVIKAGNVTLTVTSIELHADALGSDDLSEWYIVVRYTWRNDETGDTFEKDSNMRDLLRSLRKYGVI